MRLGRILAAIPALAVGLMLWRHAQWVEGPENADQDGTCAGLEAGLSYLLSIVPFLIALLVLIKGNFLRGTVQIVRRLEEDGVGPPTSPHRAHELFLRLSGAL